MNALEYAKKEFDHYRVAVKIVEEKMRPCVECGEPMPMIENWHSDSQYDMCPNCEQEDAPYERPYLDEELRT